MIVKKLNIRRIVTKDRDRTARSPHWSTYPTAGERFAKRVAADVEEEKNRRRVHHWPRDPLLDYPTVDFHMPRELPTQQRNIVGMRAVGSIPRQIMDELRIRPGTYYMHCGIIERKLGCGPLTMATARRIAGLPPRLPRIPPPRKRGTRCAECRFQELGLLVGSDYEETMRGLLTEIVEGKSDPGRLPRDIAQSLLDRIRQGR